MTKRNELDIQFTLTRRSDGSEIKLSPVRYTRVIPDFMTTLPVGAHIEDALIAAGISTDTSHNEFLYEAHVDGVDVSHTFDDMKTYTNGKISQRYAPDVGFQLCCLVYRIHPQVN